MASGIPTDALVLSCDFLSGKSIPLIVALARLPLDRRICTAMLFLGAGSGVVFCTFTNAAGRSSMAWGASAARCLHMVFAIYCSLSLAFSVGKGVSDSSGVALTCIPALALVCMAVPQRHSTPLVGFVLALAAFYALAFTPLPPPARPAPPRMDSLVARQYVYVVPRKARPVVAPADVEVSPIPDVIPTRRLLESRKSSRRLLTEAPPAVDGVIMTIGRALQIYMLSFYASVHHGPLQVLLSKEDERPQYGSYLLNHHSFYGFSIRGAVSLFRICVWLAACYIQDNHLHVVYENDLSRRSWNWGCCFLLISNLAFSSVWTATQLKEQVLPLVWGQEKRVRFLKLMASVVFLAAVHHQREFSSTFYATSALSVLTVVSVMYHMSR